MDPIIGAAVERPTKQLYQSLQTCTNPIHHRDLDLSDLPESPPNLSNIPSPDPALDLSDLSSSELGVSFNIGGELGADTAISAYLNHEQSRTHAETTFKVEYRTLIGKGHFAVRTGRGRLKW